MIIIIIYISVAMRYNAEMNIIPGQIYIVNQVFNNSRNTAYRHKLLAMGVRPGVRLRAQRVAPLGDPIQFEINGCSFSLRRHELDELLQLDAEQEDG